jgi:hypothetical protein
MSDLSTKLTVIREELTKERPNAAVDNSLDWLTFIIGILPDYMVVGKPAQIVNKIINDHQLNTRFEKLRAEITAVNGRLDTMESGIQRTQLIGATIATNTALQNSISDFFEQFKSICQASPTEFSVETTNWSTQEIINTLVSTDWVTVSASSHSSNMLSNLEVKSQKTNLVAKDSSHNVIRDSSFQGKQGGVSMTGEHLQRGDITLSEASISYGQDSHMQMGNWSMGTNPQGTRFSISCTSPQLMFQCPYCQRKFEVNRQELDGLTHFQCKLCRRVSCIK